ncbi:cbb3-type cytochrome c oxidase subunit I [Pendulispora brunnea]|uniref:Cbb3-type cytochrome c oxidase subunit I n=1 Tax=Pendulispora brunnea TaxID=2905690 RepID=A0ABZ2KBD1_9BACT
MMSRARAWLGTTEHTAIGARFITTALIFFLLGGLLALVMRLQLAVPLANVVGPDTYNQVFTTHGSTMMFLFAVPVMQGLGLYFVPLMVGARNTAFPRLAAYCYWVYLCGGLFLIVSFLSNTGPDTGWFAYVPLSGPEYSPGKRVDVWAQVVTFTELSALGVAVNVIVTVFKHKAPGMSLDRLPIFVWASLVTAFMVVFAMPAVMIGSSCLALDRLVATHFFNPAEGGDALLWQHMFWFFGHPEVYIIFLPALGMVSEIVVSCTGRTLFGYVPVVLANVGTAIMAFGLWVHHMFATGLPQLGASFFTGASILIAIPTGVQFFCWIATIWGSRPEFNASFWFVLAFFATFLVGGLSGVMLASVPLDLQVHDTFFVVAHLHYVLIGGAVFPLFGGLVHWFPKITGRRLDERLGKLSVALVFTGFNVTFFPQHVLGLHGMPRRVYTYLPESGWGTWNMVSTVGAFVLGLGVLVLLANIAVSLRAGAPAGRDPWRSPSLEWALDSPPPFRTRPTFVVSSAYPMWNGELGQVTGLAPNEQLVTRAVDAEPDHKTKIPGPTILPLFAALATTALIIACIFTPWGLPIGGAAVGSTLVAWFWPGRRGTPSFETLDRRRAEATGSFSA